MSLSCLLHIPISICRVRYDTIWSFCVLSFSTSTGSCTKNLGIICISFYFCCCFLNSFRNFWNGYARHAFYSHNQSWSKKKFCFGVFILNATASCALIEMFPSALCNSLISPVKLFLFDRWVGNRKYPFLGNRKKSLLQPLWERISSHEFFSFSFL